MNLWDVGGSVVVLDLAHNEESLAALLAVAAGLRLQGGRLVTVLGLAGDRLDGQIREMGHLAGHGSDDVVIAQKEKYLRGRSPAEMAGLLCDGIGRKVPSYDDEMSALQVVLPGRQPADVVVLMCHADRPGCEAVLTGAGGSRMAPADVRARVLAARG
jgi:cyanophycin synthetase